MAAHCTVPSLAPPSGQPCPLLHKPLLVYRPASSLAAEKALGDSVSLAFSRPTVPPPLAEFLGDAARRSCGYAVDDPPQDTKSQIMQGPTDRSPCSPWRGPEVCESVVPHRNPTRRRFRSSLYVLNWR